MTLMDALEKAQQRTTLSPDDLLQVRHVLSVADNEAEHLGKYPKMGSTVAITLMHVEDELNRRAREA